MNKHKKDVITITLLQLAMAAILLGLGYLMQTHSKETVTNMPIVLLCVPGAALLVSTVMNFFTYPTYWAFPTIVAAVCIVLDILAYQKFPYETSPLVIGLIIVIAGVTAVLGTLFHLLHAKIIK